MLLFLVVDAINVVSVIILILGPIQLNKVQGRLKKILNLKYSETQL